KSLTLQPSAIYVEYLKEFWYTVDVEEATKTITFSLSWCDKPLTITQDEFISAIGLPICKDVVPLPPKETGSHDQMNLNQQTIAYCLIYGLEIDIGAIIFSDLVHKLQNRKKNRELNICYTRFLSLIFEKLLREKAFVQPVTQSKAPTDLKTRRKRIPPSSKPESQYKVRVILPNKPVVETQHAEVTVATADATKSQVASELAEDQGNQPSAADAKKVQDQKIEEVKESKLDPMEDVTFDQKMDEIDQRNKDAEKAERDAFDSGLRSMHDDDLSSLTGFETHDSSDYFSDAQSNIVNQVSETIQSSMPLIVADTLKEQLLGLLKDALKDTLP
ncbi:hypothetical protein Tco_0916713, partial [Tanacetum coccineum]